MKVIRIISHKKHNYRIIELISLNLKIRVKYYLDQNVLSQGHIHHFHSYDAIVHAIVS